MHICASESMEYDTEKVRESIVIGGALSNILNRRHVYSQDEITETERESSMNCDNI